MPTVYVPHQQTTRHDGRPKFNLEPATEYGVVKVIRSGQRLTPTNVGEWLVDLAADLRGYAAGDYLLLAGDLAVLCAAAVLAARASGGIVNVLRYNRDEDRYYPLVLDLRADAPSVVAMSARTS